MRQAQRSKAWPLRPGCALLLLCALLVLAAGIHTGVTLRPHVLALFARWRDLRALQDSGAGSAMTPEKIVWLREQLSATRQDLQAIRAETRPLLWLAERLAWLPSIGKDLAATPALLDMAIPLCDAGWWGLLGLEPVLDALSGAGQQPGKSSLEAALPALIASQPRFAEAEQALQEARTARARLDARPLPPRLAPWIERLDSPGGLPALEAATRLAQVAPAMLGRERPVTVLVLMQNNHELRATGGFISGVGRVQLSAGKIVSTTFQDSYAVDAGCDLWAHPPPPAPLREYMWAPALMFRDANWSPDFPSSAQSAASIYRLCQGTDVDAVVALDLDAVALLLQALGPLQPEGYPAAVTSETLLEYVGQYWTAPVRSASATERDSSDWWSHRKDFMADILQAALQKVSTSPQSIALDRLALALYQSLLGKHLLVHWSDPLVARAFAAPGWDGALRPSAHDFLMLVDSNVGFRKVNPHIRQSVDYQVECSPGSRPRARLTVRYTNESSAAPECIAGARYDDSYAQMMQGCSWDYVRVYAPRGSQLRQVLGGDQGPQVSEDAGKAVFSTLLVVAPGENRELVFDYELPAALVGASPSARGGAAPERYSLWVQKQPGSPSTPLRVSVSVSGAAWQLDTPRSLGAGNGAAPVTFRLTGDTELNWILVDAHNRRTAWLPAVLGLGGVATLLAGVLVWRRASSLERRSG